MNGAALLALLFLLSAGVLTVSGQTRDPVATTKPGTAVLRGRVLAADTRQPLRRARISLSAPELTEPRSTSTGADGKYEIRDLPAGRYTVRAARSGYLSLSYGHRRPLEAGKPLQLRDGEAVGSIDFALPRMSVISGRVTDEAGEPISGVNVSAMRFTFFEGRRRVVPIGLGQSTDDTGQYRILGLTPGSYFVMGDTRETWTVHEGGQERVMGYMPTFYPSTGDIAVARRVTVGVGQESTGIDFQLIPGRAIHVSGVVFDSQGRPLAGRSVNLGQESRGPMSASYSTVADASIGADGAFRFNSVSPGEYVLRVMTTYDAGGESVQEQAWLPITVGGSPLENLTLSTSAGWQMSGRVTTATGETAGLARDKVSVVPRLVGEVDSMRRHWSAGNGRVRDDWTFTFTGIAGPARIRVAAPEGWALKSVMLGDRDVTDEVFDLRSGETLSDLQVVLTDRVTVVTGRVTDLNGKPTFDGTVLVFPADTQRWADDWMYVRAARPDQQGRYEIRGLLPGEYLAVAVDYVEENTWADPEYLESIRQFGASFRIDEGDARDVPLRVVTPTP
jgi:protocatechuate 3,4-dioxygenase beta subunit